MSFPKRGKFFPSNSSNSASQPPRQACFAAEIAAALRKSLGSTHAGIKTAAGWTGANERTAKNWFAGRYGSSGEHLVVLAGNSDEVLNAFLAMAGRPDLIAVAKLQNAE